MSPPLSVLMSVIVKLEILLKLPDSKARNSTTDFIFTLGYYSWIEAVCMFGLAPSI